MKLQALLPLVTYTDPNSDAVAANAVAVARQIGASIHALAINVDIPNMSSAVPRALLNVPDMIREAEARSRKRGEHLLAAVKDQTGAAGVDVTTEAIGETPPLLSATAAIHARYYDLALLGWEKDNATARATVESVVFGSGRPAVVLPEAQAPQDFNHIAVAWDGSRVAARALADAQMFLGSATRISVLTVVDDKPLERDVGDRLAGTLGKRGFDAAAVPLRREGRPIAELLQASAIERGASLLVMGGFGHSRIRDFVLGGATEGALNDLRLPVLISH